MKKFLIFLFIFSIIAPTFALQAPEEQIKSELEQEKKQKLQTENNEEKQVAPDYKEETKRAKQTNKRAYTRGSTSPGYEHIRSKYQAQKSMDKNKAEFERRRDLELLLLRGFTPTKEEEEKILNDKED